jgi:hypothetical protein
VGRVYQQTFVDTYSKVALAKLYDRKTPLPAADLLNDRVVPFFDSYGIFRRDRWLAAHTEARQRRAPVRLRHLHFIRARGAAVRHPELRFRSRAAAICTVMQ